MVIKISSSLKLSEHTLWYKNPAKNFNEALPLGNGRIGACVYGDVFDDVISLNEDTLWSGYPKTPAPDGYTEIYQKAKVLVNDGCIGEAQRLLEENFGDYLVQMYLPLGKIHIKTEHTGRISKYRRELRLDKALHRVTYSNAGRNFVREAFVSVPNQVLAVNISCDKPASVDFSLELESQLQVERTVRGNTICIEGNAPDAVAGYGEMYDTTEKQVYNDDPKKKGVGFTAAVSVKAIGGTVSAFDDCLIISGADSATIYFAVRTGFAGWNIHPSDADIPHKKQCIQDIQQAKKIAYFDLVNENTVAHKRLYERSNISLCDGMGGSIPTDERLRLHAEGNEDNALYALFFNYGKYLAISSSREGTQPANLQGIWNEKILPPWNCNYTLNINTEMNYWPMLACGLFECYMPLVKMAEELAQSGEVTAKTFYGADGWVCHHSTDIWRLTHPGTNRLKNNAQWGFWNMASGWISVMLWEYYRYTEDRDYLERIYPIIAGAAKFYSQLLCENEKGELILSPSTSPENNYIENGETHAVDRSTAMSQEILFDLFGAVSKAQRLLGKTDEYGELKNRLKRPSVQSDGQLCEWDSEHNVWDVHHRHVSHLYGLFPSEQFENELKEGCKKVLESRGDNGTGWSLAWKINLWARLYDGEHAFKLLKRQLEPVNSACESTEYGGGSYPNLFCAHPPFQIDGNFGACSGIIQMLVQTDEDGEPILLPAAPKQWKNGRVTGIRLTHNRSVSFEWRDGKIINTAIEEL